MQIIQPWLNWYYFTSWHLLKMFKISNFFVSLPDDFKLVHEKMNYEWLSFSFFFFLKGKGNCFIILSKDCTSQFFH